MKIESNINDTVFIDLIKGSYPIVFSKENSCQKNKFMKIWKIFVNLRNNKENKSAAKILIYK